MKLVDTEGKDITMFYRTPNEDAGHIMIQVVDHMTGKVQATWSFGPKNNMEALGVALNKNSYVEGHQHTEAEFKKYIEDNEKLGLIKKATIETDREVDKIVAHNIEMRKLVTEYYSLFYNNCGTTAVDLINSSGVINLNLSFLASIFPFPEFMFSSFVEEQNRLKKKALIEMMNGTIDEMEKNDAANGGGFWGNYGNDPWPE